MRRRPILPFMPRPTPRKTIDDYFALDDDGKTELLDGEFVVSTAPGLSHQIAVASLLSILLRQVRALRLGRVLPGPFDVVLSRTSVVHPDILFLGNAGLSRLSDTLAGPPDLAVEFLSPRNLKNDLEGKMKIYLEHGVPQYWIGDPRAMTIRVLENGGDRWIEKGTFGAGDVIRPAGMPGVVVDVSEVYEITPA